MPSMCTPLSSGPLPRTMSSPKSNGDRATPGRFCTTRTGSPKVPGIRSIVSMEMERRATSFSILRPRTVVSGIPTAFSLRK